MIMFPWLDIATITHCFMLEGCENVRSLAKDKLRLDVASLFFLIWKPFFK